MSTTNDPRAPYGEAWTGKPKNRLLSVQEMMMGNMQAMDVADFYESLVSSGELITKAEHERLYKEALDRVFGPRK